jgi:hypothetical protein
MTTKKPLFCPHLTQGQIVSFGLTGLVIPHGEAEVATQSDLGALGAGLKAPTHPKSRGGIDLSQIGAGTKKLPIYRVDFNSKLKTPVGTDPADPDPTLLPTAAMIPCQGPACAFWCAAHETCREVCNACRAQTFVDALATHHRAKQAAPSPPLNTHQPGQNVPGEPA